MVRAAESGTVATPQEYIGVTEIAEAEGIGRTLASREANSPECRQLIAEFVSGEYDEMRGLFYRSLRAIEYALSARREYMRRDGRSFMMGRTITRGSRQRSTSRLFSWLDDRHRKCAFFFAALFSVPCTRKQILLARVNTIAQSFGLQSRT